MLGAAACQYWSNLINASSDSCGTCAGGSAAAALGLSQDSVCTAAPCGHTRRLCGTLEQRAMPTGGKSIPSALHGVPGSDQPQEARHQSMVPKSKQAAAVPASQCKEQQQQEKEEDEGAPLINDTPAQRMLLTCTRYMQ